MRAFCLILALVTLAGCTYSVADPTGGSPLAKCHDGLFTSFCQVEQPPGTAIVSGGAVTGWIGAATVLPSHSAWQW